MRISGLWTGSPREIPETLARLARKVLDGGDVGLACSTGTDGGHIGVGRVPRDVDVSAGTVANYGRAQ